MVADMPDGFAQAEKRLPLFIFILLVKLDML
jgi:hypothetical protein